MTVRNHTIVNSTIEITLIDEVGSVYECAVESGEEVERRTYNLLLKGKYYFFIIY